MIRKIKVKICCISSIDEAELAIRYGASAIGLVSEMPSGPGVIEEELITRISTSVPSDISTFLLTSKTNALEIIGQQRRTKVNTLQLVDKIPFDELEILRENLPGIKLVQVIHVLDENSIEEATAVEKYVDAILLDSGNPNLAIKQLGGTGRIHNWALSSEICKVVKKPVFLAGGLNAGNVVEAIEKVNPFGVDICNGVRTDKKIDELKLKSFFDEINHYNAKQPDY